jgi:hypothetical protein
MQRKDRPMMTCGHVANSKSRQSESNPEGYACVICSCFEIAKETPDFTGRVAHCAYGCGSEQPSDPQKLAFFEHGHGWGENKKFDHDTYYCGCRGWD